MEFWPVRVSKICGLAISSRGRSQLIGPLKSEFNCWLAYSEAIPILSLLCELRWLTWLTGGFVMLLKSLPDSMGFLLLFVWGCYPSPKQLVALSLWQRRNASNAVFAEIYCHSSGSEVYNNGKYLSWKEERNSLKLWIILSLLLDLASLHECSRLLSGSQHLTEAFRSV